MGIYRGKKERYMEKDLKRDFFKALTWRVLATTITFLIAWAILGKVEYAAGIAWLDMLVKLVAYMGHEKIWLSISKNSKGS